MKSVITLSLAAVLVGLGGAAHAQQAQPAPAPGAAPAPPAIWNQCRACHQIGETARNTVGPILNGIFGRRAGTREGFNYSQAYRTPPVSEKTWDEDNFRVYIRNPMQVTPGTRMAFGGVRDEAQINELIAFLRSYGPDGRRVP